MVRPFRRVQHCDGTVGHDAVSIQLLDIVLYSTRGERRVLSFRPGALNIVTGDSKTGKSALIDIVDYCLGSSTCAVPEGEIRNTVAWYAIRLTDGSGQHFVARRAPDLGRATTSDAYYSLGSTVPIPEATDLAATDNIGSVIDRLTSVVGIASNLHEPPEGQTREPVTAKLRHALAFVFQPQNEISQRAFLFHQQSDHWVAQSIKDTLPYFLGAVEDDHVAAKAKLKDLRRRLREQERALARAQAVAGEGVGAAGALLAEARDVGILPPEASPQSWTDAVEVLRRAASASSVEQLARAEQSPGQAELERLNEDFRRLRHRLQRETDDLGAMKLLLADENGFSGEVQQQVSRLASLHLLAPHGEARCPLCDQAIGERVPASEELSAELRRASGQLERVVRHTPGLEALVVEQEAKISKTKRLLQENRSAREAVRRIDETLATTHDAATLRAHTLGRISLFLETLPQVEDSSQFKVEIARLQREIERIARELSDEAVQERLDSILSVISRSLTVWATRLELEHQGNPFRLDLRRLQLVADTDSGAIPMDRMGSGANWVGCHLMAHLALHSWFVRKARPVPRFLFLDQPSQVYFPAERDIEGAIDAKADEDRLAVLRMFELMRDVVAELNPGLQIIVTEHADFKEDWYQRAVVERWRNGAALIPLAWSSRSDSSPEGERIGDTGHRY